MQADSRTLKIYLDTCCLSRRFDDQTQTRIYRETEAIRQILDYFQDGHWLWISSDVLVDEIENNPNETERIQIKRWLIHVDQDIAVETSEISRGRQLETLTFQAKDALHLACAESGSADVLLTTDDRLLNKARSVQTQLNIEVDNPLEWLQKVRKNEHT